LKEESE
jgi:hypothetical protein